MPPPSRIEAKAGFTLIETMAVMSIVALVASLVIASTPGAGRLRLKAVSMETATLLRRARQSAILSGADRGVSLDGARRVLVGDGGGEVAIPQDVVVDILGVDDLWSGRVPVAIFHPDGASTGAALRFSREAAQYEIRVNWYSGGVSVKAD